MFSLGLQDLHLLGIIQEVYNQRNSMLVITPSEACTENQYRLLDIPNIWDISLSSFCQFYPFQFHNFSKMKFVISVNKCLCAIGSETPCLRSG